MIIFLTSSPTGPLDGSRYVDGLDKKNHFVDQLKKYWKKESRCCIITASPEAFSQNDEMCDYFRNAFCKEHFSMQCFDLIDRRYPLTKEKLHSYDVVILGGGHVPTQNKYFQDIQLKEKIQGFQGIVIGISAGSMNCAQLVYCQPEEDGESIDPCFQRWIDGLNLTTINVIPHYQMVKDRYLDGMRLYEDITYKDSINHSFIVLVDGSYILIDSKATVYGESYIICDGHINLLCYENERFELRRNKE